MTDILCVNDGRVALMYFDKPDCYDDDVMTHYYYFRVLLVMSYCLLSTSGGWPATAASFVYCYWYVIQYYSVTVDEMHCVRNSDDLSVFDDWLIFDYWPIVENWYGYWYSLKYSVLCILLLYSLLLFWLSVCVCCDIVIFNDLLCVSLNIILLCVLCNHYIINQYFVWYCWKWWQ